MSKILEVNNLSFSYIDNIDVLSDVSFSINEGEYTSIIGHNGSGKSTIAKLLIGLLAAKEGSLKAFDLEYSKKTIREIRKHFGIVFQNPDNQFIGATVEDDIAFGLENKLVKHEDMQSIINEYAKKVNMLEYLKKEPSTLSGGQKQRVAIAGVLALEPDILILDEATAMLDPKGKREIREIISLLRKDNPKLSIISITHDIEEAFSGDHLIVLNKGKVLFDDTPENVLKHQDELLEIGLDIPFKVRLAQELDKAHLKKVKDDLCL